MKYTSKLIIKESAKEFNQAINQYLASIPDHIKVISCDHNIGFKTVVAQNDALFSCLIVMGE